MKCFQGQQILVTLVFCGTIFFPHILSLLGSLCLARPLLVKHVCPSVVSSLLSHLLYLFPTAVTPKQPSGMLSRSPSILSEFPLNMIVKPNSKPVLILLLNERLGCMSSFGLAMAKTV